MKARERQAGVAWRAPQKPDGSLDPGLDEAAKSVRSGVVIGWATEGEKVLRDAPALERIKAFGRRQLQHVRAKSASLRDRLGVHLPGVEDRELRGDELAAQARAVRLNERDVLIRTPFGWVIAPAQDEGLVSRLMDAGSLEPGTTKVLCALISDGDTVIEAEAGTGLSTIPAARRVGTSGLVIAFEASPPLADTLARNLALNKLLGRVQVEIKDCAVPAFTIDDVVPARSRVSTVKIDAQGRELNIWRGMQRVVRESPECALIVGRGSAGRQGEARSDQAWLGEVLASGFDAFEIDERSGSCTRLSAASNGAIVSANLLLVRRPPSRYPGIEFV